jgi:hypothetical protein
VTERLSEGECMHAHARTCVRPFVRLSVRERKGKVLSFVLRCVVAESARAASWLEAGRQERFADAALIVG